MRFIFLTQVVIASKYIARFLESMYSVPQTHI